MLRKISQFWRIQAFSGYSVVMTTEGAPAVPTADAIVGEKVFHWMWRMKISQTEMARHLGISQTNVSRRLRGETGWTIDDIITAARVLRLSPGDLLPGDDYEGRPGGGGTQYAIRDSNPEPADYGSADATILQMPRRPRPISGERAASTQTGWGATVVRLEARSSRRTTTSSAWCDQASS